MVCFFITLISAHVQIDIFPKYFALNSKLIYLSYLAKHDSRVHNIFTFNEYNIYYNVHFTNPIYYLLIITDTFFNIFKHNHSMVENFNHIINYPMTFSLNVVKNLERAHHIKKNLDHAYMLLILIELI